MRKFHMDGDTPYNLGLHNPQLVSPEIRCKTPLALRESRKTDRPRLRPISHLVAGQGVEGRGDRQDHPACANSPAHGTSCGVAQGQEKGQVWMGVAHASSFLP